MQNGEYLLAREKVGKAVWKLMLPSVLTTMISMIYNFTDTFFIGLLRDTQQLSALSLSMPLMWFFGALHGLISGGANQVISLRLGAGDREGAKRVASFSVCGTAALCLLGTLLSLCLLRPSLRLIGARGEVMEYALRYLAISFAGQIFATGSAMLGILQAHGRAHAASVGSIIGIAVNIALDPLFILVFDLGVAGAAAATVIGSACSFVYAFIVTRGEYSLKMAIPDAKTAKKVVALSLSSCITSVVNSLIVGLSFSMATGYGDEVVAAVSVGSKLYSFLCSLVSAVCFSLQAFVGYNYSAGNVRRLKKGLLLAFGLGTGLCLAGSVLFLMLPEQYMRLFTDDPAVLEAGAKMIRFFAIGAPLVALNMTCVMLLSATAQAVRSLIAGLGRQIVIFIPLLLALRALLGLDGIILSYPLTDILATLLALALAKNIVWQILRQK